MKHVLSVNVHPLDHEHQHACINAVTAYIGTELILYALVDMSYIALNHYKNRLVAA